MASTTTLDAKRKWEVLVLSNHCPPAEPITPPFRTTVLADATAPRPQRSRKRSRKLLPGSRKNRCPSRRWCRRVRRGKWQVAQVFACRRLSVSGPLGWTDFLTHRRADDSSSGCCGRGGFPLWFGRPQNRKHPRNREQRLGQPPAKRKSTRKERPASKGFPLL